MNNSILSNENETIKYSKVLSAFFSSISIITLSILCLLNNPTVDLYSAYTLLKVVIPAGICFWFIGFVIGKIFDGLSIQIVEEEIKEEKKAYEIPSMFSSEEEYSVEDIGEL